MAEYSCKWNEHVPNLLTGMENLKSTENYVDVTLVCESRAIKAHKLILSTCSALFHEMFSSNPCAHPIIILQDMKFSTLQAIINFMYRGEIGVLHDDLELLIKAAKALGIKGLSDICKEMLLGALISDMEVQCNDESVNTSSSNSSPRKKRARKRSRESDVSDDKENVNAEGVFAQTEECADVNPQIAETSTFSVSASSSVPSSSDTLHSVTDSISEATPIKKNAATSYEENPSPTKQPNMQVLQKKKILPSDQDDADGTLMAKKKSFIWNFFTPLNDSIAECNSCLLNKSYRSSISNLKAHLRKKHPSIDLKAARDLQKNYQIEEQPNANAVGKKGTKSSEDIVFDHSGDDFADCPKDAYMKRKTSFIWNYFTPQDDMIAECNTCLANKSYRSSISNLKRHLERRHPSISLPCPMQNFEEEEDITAEITDENGKSQFVILRKRPRVQMGKKKSYIWNFFTPLNDDIAECNICLKSKSYRSSISNLKVHLKKKHPSIDLTSARQLQNYAQIYRYKPQTSAIETQSTCFEEETFQEVTVETSQETTEKTLSMPIIHKLI